jgi:hypothetical protein
MSKRNSPRVQELRKTFLQILSSKPTLANYHAAGQVDMTAAKLRRLRPPSTLKQYVRATVKAFLAIGPLRRGIPLMEDLQPSLSPENAAYLGKALRAVKDVDAAMGRVTTAMASLTHNLGLTKPGKSQRK